MSGVINIKNLAGDVEFVGSRQTGAIIREEMLDLIHQGGGVTLDFGGINTVTQSFIDEFIGILTRAKGLDFIAKNVRTVNDNKNIKDTLNFVITYSLRKAA